MKVRTSFSYISLTALVISLKKVHFRGGGKKPIKSLEVKIFFNHRYTSKVDKEFRRFLLPENTLKIYLSNNLWIKQLPSN